jgi:hypothetical protein
MISPCDLEFTPWHEDKSDDLHTGIERGDHGWTGESRRKSATFGWSLQGYNTQGETVELIYKKGCIGQYETGFDSHIEGIADIVEFVKQNEVLRNLTIHPDTQTAVAQVSHTGTGRGQNCAIRFIKANQKRKKEYGGRALNWSLVIQGFQ